jgi:DNA-binding transcriptional ArsR family regulator
MQNSVFKALAHPLRRELLSILRAEASLAGDLADMFDVSWPTVSRHLSVLKDANLVITERNGNQILYRLNTSVVQDAAALLLGLAGAGATLPEDDGLRVTQEPKTTKITDMEPNQTSQRTRT